MQTAGPLKQIKIAFSVFTLKCMIFNNFSSLLYCGHTRKQFILKNSLNNVTTLGFYSPSKHFHIFFEAELDIFFNFPK